jgi:hypothetical protein
MQFEYSDKVKSKWHSAHPGPLADAKAQSVYP